MVSPAKTAEPTEIPFGVWTQLSLRNHVLDGSTDPHVKVQFWWEKRYLHGKWLTERARWTILLQRNPSFGQRLDKVHFSCRRLCWKVTKYNVLVHILWLSVLVYELFERPLYSHKVNIINNVSSCSKSKGIATRWRHPSGFWQTGIPETDVHLWGVHAVTGVGLAQNLPLLCRASDSAIAVDCAHVISCFQSGRLLICWNLPTV